MSGKLSDDLQHFFVLHSQLSETPLFSLDSSSHRAMSVACHFASACARRTSTQVDPVRKSSRGSSILEEACVVGPGRGQDSGNDAGGARPGAPAASLGGAAACCTSRRIPSMCEEQVHAHASTPSCHSTHTPAHSHKHDHYNTPKCHSRPRKQSSRSSKIPSVWRRVLKKTPPQM